jgi:hypothetical protein
MKGSKSEAVKWSNPKMLVLAFLGFVLFGALITVTFGSAFLGEQTRLIYNCKKNPKYSAKCAQALAGPAGIPQENPEDESLGISPMAF